MFGICLCETGFTGSTRKAPVVLLSLSRFLGFDT